MKQKIKNKKAISEIIAYTILIVIAITVAAIVSISFVKLVPTEKELCPEEVALVVNDYCVDIDSKILSLTIENKGYFDVNGFFIKASKDARGIPTVGLQCISGGLQCSTAIFVNESGRYYFNEGKEKMHPGNITNIKFSYKDIKNIEKIEIQPFIIGTIKGQEDIKLCENIVRIVIDEGRKC